MRIEEIEKLVEMAERAGLQELTLREDDRRFTVRRTPPAPSSTVSAGLAVRDGQELQPESNGAAPAAPRNVMDGSSDELPSVTPAPAAQARTIPAPMVGVFHHAEPPVAAGVRIESGQVVGVIESMKLMNDIRAEQSGVVSEVMIEAGMAVEYGQPLFALQA